jgi:hypothetical protein
MTTPDPFGGFEVAVLVDRPVYPEGIPVRITVTATNADLPVTLTYPGWCRFDLTVRDEHHREVAGLDVADPEPDGFTDRWLPGQMQLHPLYWAQRHGPIVPAWSRTPVGPRPAPGRHRVRLTWLGRPAQGWARLPDVHSAWFELV